MTAHVGNWIPVVAASVGVMGGVLTTLLSIRGERRRLTDELALQRTKFEAELASQRATLKAEYGTQESAEAAIRHFLSIHQLRYRTFPMLRHHLGGFESNELRRLLVRAGAVRFMAKDGTELWALRDRVDDDFQRSQWIHPEAPRNKVPEGELFPAAFKKNDEF